MTLFLEFDLVLRDTFGEIKAKRRKTGSQPNRESEIQSTPQCGNYSDVIRVDDHTKYFSSVWSYSQTAFGEHILGVI